MDKKKAYIIGLSLFALSIISFSFTVSHFSSNDDTYASWMKEIDDDKYLNEFLIPGTHDSGATMGIYDIAGACQDTTITEQLNFGARFLDIRLKSIQNSLYIYHGFINEELYFDDVLDDIYEFLNDNPSETIIMSIKEEQDSSSSTYTFDELVEYQISLNSSYWYIENELPTLGDVRGKIVLFSRYEDASSGILAYDGWEDSVTFDMDNGVKMHVQDEYRLEDNDTKYNAIINAIEYSNENLDTFTINFCSGYIDYKVLGVSLSNAYTTAKEINPKMVEYFSAGENIKPIGVILFDFYNLELAKVLLDD